MKPAGRTRALGAPGRLGFVQNATATSSDSAMSPPYLGGRKMQ